MDLLKVKALKKRADQLPDANFELLKLAVNFKVDGIDPKTGVERHPCIDCGDCITGCNVRAKNTLYMNYLPLARKAGVEIFTQVRVRYIEAIPKPKGGYQIHYERFIPRHTLPETGSIRAKHAVVVSAGSLGSTEIMLRSRVKGLKLPDTVGTRFSGNGDFFGVAYNSDQRTDILGFGNHPNDPPRSNVKAGPTIMGVIRYDRNKPLKEQITVEDLSVPRAGVTRTREVLGILSAGGKDTDPGDLFQELARIAQDKQFNVDGALNRTMIYLVMSHDTADGRMSLKSDKLSIDWPGVGEQKIFERINAELFQHAKALGATFIESPVWNFFNARRLITAHPLGGCPMGEARHTGLVDECGRVFNGEGDRSIHPGLFISDGSIIPTAIGVNPFMTISALSEYIAQCVIKELKK
jgi:cholesterol oxidase